MSMTMKVSAKIMAFEYINITMQYFSLVPTFHCYKDDVYANLLVK